MNKKITFQGVLSNGFALGLKNVVPLILTYLLWIVTIWIPYLNVGTTIAINTIPLELSKGKVINPTFIFGAQYRQYMGEYLILMGLMGMAMFVAAIFFIIPAVVIGIAWSLAVLLLLDKKISPLEAIMESNKLTYGYKLTIFLVSFVIGVISFILNLILGLIPVIGTIVAIAISSAIGSACNAIIYRDLTAVSPAPISTPEIEA
ncbi:MAG: hypothetical protein SNG27_02590 [Rikenellaceae bacterium]